MMDVWLDHAALGCGVRMLLVLRDGRTKARVLCIATMRAITVDRDLVCTARQ